MTDLSASLLARLDESLHRAADPVRAAAMAAYMRDQFPFLGIPAPALRRQERVAFAGLPAPTEADLTDVATACWARPEREFQYVACDYLRRYESAASPAFLTTTGRVLLTTRAWWDTVDPLSTRFVGAMVSRHAELVTVMDDWSHAEDIWLIRTAILHQLHHREATDTDRLFAYCLRQADHQDFFIRKAIGWALRHHARTDPAAIRTFLDTHRGRLSTLSVREAAKHL